MFGVTGEELYSAPELSSGQYYDETVDCWSAGIVMYMLLTKGRKLKIFPHDSIEEIQSVIDSKLSKLKTKGTSWNEEIE